MASNDVKVVLVEDDEGQAELVKMNLERSKLGSEVFHFATGHSAMAFLERDMASATHSRYLVILDINMPGMDGLQMLSRLKQGAATRSIPVIIFTTAEDESGIEECYALGCNLYMLKPVEYNDFTQSVQELGLFIQKAKIPAIQKVAA